MKPLTSGARRQILSASGPESEKQDEDRRAGLYIKTFGCQMNEYDSEKMSVLLSSTHRRVPNPEEAQLVLINTCSVRQKAEDKLFSLLGTLRELKQANPALVVGVTGCVAQQEGQAVIKKNPLVNFVVGTHNLSFVPSLVDNARAGGPAQVAIDYRDEWEELPEHCNRFPEPPSAPQAGVSVSSASLVDPSRVRALVAIQRGCNKRCAFCVVPETRGPQVSRDPEEIEKEVRYKVSLGAREVLLLGQTVNSYGRDISPRSSFQDLISRVADIEGVRRIRFTSPHPADVRPEFIALYGTIKQLCPHIHLPLQSGSDRILRLMRRSYRSRRYLEIVSELRGQCPEIAITTDLIVGFPTETEQDFEETLDMVSSVRYHSSFSFKYSRRPGTTALSEYREEEEVPEEIAHRRLLRLQALQDRISQELNQDLLGSSVEVLVEGPHKKISSLRGRIAQNTPIELRGGGASAGDIVQAVVEYAGAHGLRGRIISQSNTD